MTKILLTVSNNKTEQKLKSKIMDNYAISQITETLSWLGFFAAIILSFYFYLRFRNKEKMALIEKGVDVSEIYRNRENSARFTWLKGGILAISIGLGVLVTFLYLTLQDRNNYENAQLVLIFSLLIFGGLGILLGNILEKSGKKRNG